MRVDNANQIIMLKKRGDKVEALGDGDGSGMTEVRVLEVNMMKIHCIEFSKN